MPEQTIPITKPWMGEEEAAAARRPILAGWVTQGPEVAAFEQEFAGYTGAAHACAVSNCTTALHLALKAVGVGTGDEVITVSHSFIATASAVRYCGATPVFVDIDPATFNLDPDLLERVITPRTRAILCVHQVGMPCDLSRICKIARDHSLPVVEDAACAIGSEILWNGNWEKIGKPHDEVACFSFHPRKLVSTGDGGMLTTNRAELDAKFRLWRQHSMSLPDTVRHSSRQVLFETYPEVGYNYRMTDIQAAVGREQLKRLPAMMEKRRRFAARYRVLLDDAGVILPVEPEWARSNWQSFCVRLPEGCSQTAVMQSMLDDGVATRRGIMCSHREPAYQQEPWSCGEIHPHQDGCPRLRQSEQAQDRGLILPLFHQMTEEQQDTVCRSLRRAMSEVASEASAR
jgi:dTDP-4-amino-4,6-dideoxygalactose transaminase